MIAEPHQLHDGDTLRVVSGHEHSFSCCDCGLAHWVRLEVGDPEHVIVRIWADAERTAKNRERP